MRENLPVPLYSPPSAFKELRDKLTQLEKRLDSRVCKGFPFEKIGVTFTRWGRTKCPKDNTELVYSGFVGGSYFTHKGAAVDYLCMPEKPEWDGHKYKNGTGGDKGYVYGAEYETYDNSIGIDKPHHNHDVPCVVCRIVASASVLMIPGKYEYIPFENEIERMW